MKSLDCLPVGREEREEREELKKVHKKELKKEQIEREESVSDNFGYAQVGESSRPSQGDIIQRKHERSRSM